MTPIDVRVAVSDEDVAAHHAVRHEVFVREQGIFADHDLDVWDDGAVKVIAVAGSRVLGAVRLYPLDEAGLWKGDRLAVLPDGPAPAHRRAAGALRRADGGRCAAARG